MLLSLRPQKFEIYRGKNKKRKEKIALSSSLLLFFFFLPFPNFPTFSSIPLCEICESSRKKGSERERHGGRRPANDRSEPGPHSRPAPPLRASRDAFILLPEHSPSRSQRPPLLLLSRRQSHRPPPHLRRSGPTWLVRRRIRPRRSRVRLRIPP